VENVDEQVEILDKCLNKADSVPKGLPHLSVKTMQSVSFDDKGSFEATFSSIFI